MNNESLYCERGDEDDTGSHDEGSGHHHDLTQERLDAGIAGAPQAPLTLNI